jgi:hypothetical protein
MKSPKQNFSQWNLQFWVALGYFPPGPPNMNFSSPSSSTRCFLQMIRAQTRRSNDPAPRGFPQGD